MSSSAPAKEHEARADADELPSYSELDLSGRQSNDRHIPSDRMLFGPGIASEVEYRRQEIVRAAVETHVLPVLKRQARYGLAKSTVVLQPRAATPSRPDAWSSAYEKRDYEPEPEAAGEQGEVISPSEDNMTLAKLEGDANSAEFWAQPAVVSELEHQLRNILCTTSIFEGVEIHGSTKSAPPYAATGRFGKARRRNAVDVPLAHPPKNSDGVQLSVEREDIVMRTISPFGLFETATRPGVVVRIEVIC